jgi:hypothetical protein
MDEALYKVLEEDVHRALLLEGCQRENLLAVLSQSLRQAVATFPGDRRLGELAAGFERACHADYIKAHKLQKLLDGLVDVAVTTRTQDPLLEMVAALDKYGV